MSSIFGIYLAAGASRRMRKNKLALPFEEDYLGSVALNTILQADHFVAAAFDGMTRPPILFSERLFPHLLQLQGDIGARQIIRKVMKDNGTVIEFSDGTSFFDIDTEEDYLLAKMIQTGRERI